MPRYKLLIAPVLAGLLLSVDDDALTISGFDLEASTRINLDVNVGTAGQALVSGRLLAEITRSLPPHPVDVALDGLYEAVEAGPVTVSTMGRGLADDPAYFLACAAAGRHAASLLA